MSPPPLWLGGHNDWDTEQLYEHRDAHVMHYLRQNWYKLKKKQNFFLSEMTKKIGVSGKMVGRSVNSKPKHF